MSAASRFTKADLVLAGAGLVAAVLFFASLRVLWPLLDVELAPERQDIEAQARTFLEGRGYDVTAHRSASVLTVDDEALDWLERAFGRERTQGWLREGVPLAEVQVGFKRAGDPRSFVVFVHPAAGISGWMHALEEDDPGETLDVEEARARVREALAGALSVELDRWVERSVSTVERPARRDHTFTWERDLDTASDTRERIVARCAGSEVAVAQRYVVVPGPARRQARASEAPGRAMESAGFALLAAFAIAAFLVFLTRLRDGSVRLWRAAALAAIVFVCLVGTWSLQTGMLFLRWEPLWPQWVSSLQYLVARVSGEIWMTLVLLALIGAGDALDRGTGADRGRSLWSLLAGRIADRTVGLASFRGFLVGMLCGGTMSVAVLALIATGGSTSLQPRGFFFYALNSASPAASTLLFFLNVALLEELGYRFFGGTWMLGWTRRRWIAIVVPAIVYGLTHTRLDFLPVAEPWWGRAVVLALVGCVWGWAFFRYDALTVVLSHWTADLFIFNWPRLASGRPEVVAAAGVTILVPLIPAALAGIAWLRRNRRRGTR